MHQGLEQDVVQNPGCTNAATTSTKTQDQRPSLEHKGSLEHRDNAPSLPAQQLSLPVAVAVTAGSAYVNHDNDGGSISRACGLT